jgi:hypothetical protein
MDCFRSKHGASPHALQKHQLSTNQNNFIPQKNLFISNILRTSNLKAQNISHRILHFGWGGGGQLLLLMLHDVETLTF